MEDSDMTATLDSIVAHLPTLVAALSALDPGAACRIARGARLVAADAVQPIGPVTLVTSESEPTTAYSVIRVGDVLTCTCPDFLNRGGPCKHGWASVILTAAERLDADASAPADAYE